MGWRESTAFGEVDNSKLTDLDKRYLSKLRKRDVINIVGSAANPPQEALKGTLPRLIELATQDNIPIIKIEVGQLSFTYDVVTREIVNFKVSDFYKNLVNVKLMQTLTQEVIDGLNRSQPVRVANSPQTFISKLTGFLNRSGLTKLSGSHDDNGLEGSLPQTVEIPMLDFSEDSMPSHIDRTLNRQFKTIFGYTNQELRVFLDRGDSFSPDIIDLLITKIPEAIPGIIDSIASSRDLDLSSKITAFTDTMEYLSAIKSIIKRASEPNSPKLSSLHTVLDVTRLYIDNVIGSKPEYLEFVQDSIKRNAQV